MNDDELFKELLNSANPISEEGKEFYDKLFMAALVVREDYLNQTREERVWHDAKTWCGEEEEREIKDVTPRVKQLRGSSTTKPT